MPATLILTTPDPGLEAAWKKQLHPREPAAFSRPADLQRDLLRPGSRVWITDINDPRTRLACGAGTLVILVGQPHSLPFEQARQNRACLIALGWGGGLLAKSSWLDTTNPDYRQILQQYALYNRALSTNLPFPKTRKIVFLNNRPATLPGWAELTVG